MFFVDKGESFEGINALNQAIALLLKSSGEKHEDMSKHFELFKKVEIKFNSLLEWRIQVTNTVAVETLEKDKKKKRRIAKQEETKENARKFEEVKKQRMIEKSKAKEELLQSLGRRLP